MTHDFQHEIELVVAIGEGAGRFQPNRRTGTFSAMPVGLDMTRRDLQMNARKQGRPVGHGEGL